MLLLAYLICIIKNCVCCCSVSKTSVTHSSVVLRALLSLAILQRDTELAADILPSSVQLARDNSELAWLAAFCHLLQVWCHIRVTECIHVALVFLSIKDRCDNFLSVIIVIIIIINKKLRYRRETVLQGGSVVAKSV